MINKQKIIMIGDATKDSSLSALEVFKESGIDTFVLYPNDDDHYGAIKRCGEIGLDVFVFGGSSVCESNKCFFPYAVGLFPNFISRYQEENVDLNCYSELSGLYMIDEPDQKFFDLINEYYLPWFNNKYSDKKIWHVNMLPSYAPVFSDAKNGHLNAFKDYIAKYSEEVLSGVKGVKTLGVDHYPLREKNGVKNLSDEWLFDLAVVGAWAKKSEAIYSVCIQAFCDVDQKKVDCTADIGFQLYTAMAFGASMFEFYAYTTAHGTLAMLDDQDKPTDIYYSVRNAIKEIRSFEKVYLQYEWQGVKCYLPQNVTCVAFDKIIEYQTNLMGIESVNVSRETIVSEFANEKGKKAYIVANYGMPDLSKSNIVEITFNKARNITIYQAGREEVLDIKDNKVVLFLDAGQGAFVVVNE